MGNIDYSRESVAKLFGVANREVFIYEGGFDPALFQDASVVPSIRAAVNRGVSVEVICDTSAQITNAGIQHMVDEGGIRVYRLEMNKGRGMCSLFSKYHLDRGHYMVVDGEHIRTEEPHDLLSNTRYPLVDYAEQNKAERYRRDFHEIKIEIGTR